MGFVDSIKNFAGFGQPEDEYYDDELLEEDYQDGYEDQITEKKNFSYFGRRNNVVQMPNQGGSQASITIIKPKKFDDVAMIADVIKSRRPVIFDVAEMDESGTATKIVDFMSGVVYGLNGSIKKVSGGIFIAAPENMSIASEDTRQNTRSTLNLDL